MVCHQRSSGVRRSPCRADLSLAEREEIALLLVQGHGVCEIARRLSRAASTVSREIRRHAATRSGNFEYRATTARWHAERAARRPKVARLAAHDTLRRWVEDRLSGAVAKPGDTVRMRAGIVAQAGPKAVIKRFLWQSQLRSVRS